MAEEEIKKETKKNTASKVEKKVSAKSSAKADSDVAVKTAAKKSTGSTSKAPKTDEKSEVATKPVKTEDVKAVKAKAPVKKEQKSKSKKELKDISITLKRSGIGRSKDQKAALVGMGFKKLNQTVTLKDTSSSRGMIRKVAHLVEVKEVSSL